MVTARIIVKGVVQGVGYRYFCYRKASEFGISGYVKNLYNGNVELEVEGGKNLIRDFMKELKIGPSRSKVTSIDVDFDEYQNKYNEFRMY